MLKLIQLTLDLFDPPVTPVPAQPLQAAPVPAVPVAVAAPAESLDDVLPPASFAHPSANRRIVLDNTLVAFELRRARRRHIGFAVGADGLTVSAPKWVPLYEVDAAVRSKASWILAKLDEARQRQQRMEAARIEWRDGTTFPYLGEQVIVVLDPRVEANALLHEAPETLPGVTRLTLHVGLPQTCTPEQLRDAVQAWLMRQAKRVFTERLDHFAPLLGVQWRKLALSNAATRWGTAHSDGTIRLNWRLIHFGLPVVDYVVAHELSHLRVMDHSPRFWDTVATVVPDFAQRRRQLQDDALPRW